MGLPHSPPEGLEKSRGVGRRSIGLVVTGAGSGGHSEACFSGPFAPAPAIPPLWFAGCACCAYPGGMHEANVSRAAARARNLPPRGRAIVSRWLNTQIPNQCMISLHALRSQTRGDSLPSHTFRSEAI